MEEASIALAYQLQMEEGGGQNLQQMETAEDEDESSLQLAIRLQQEELQWHGSIEGSGADDQDLRLAMQLSQQQEE